MKKRTAFARLLVVALLGLMTLAACGDPTATTSGGTPTKKSVTLALSYIPNVQFAPYYVAQDKGYFAAEGLDVTFKYGQVNDLLTVVSQGTIPFAIASGDEVLQARAQGIPITYILTQYQKYPVAVASLKGKGMTSAAALKGKTIGVPGHYGSTYIGLRAILAAAGLTESDVTVQDIGYTQAASLTQGKVDAVSVYSMNEPVQLQSAGTSLDLLQVADAANLASVGVVTGDKLIKEDRDLVQRMARAIARGIKDTLADPDAAFASSIKIAPDAKGDNSDLQKAVLRETVAYMNSTAVKGQAIGYSIPAQWDASQSFLLAQKLIATKLDPTTVYTNAFVDVANGTYP